MAKFTNIVVGECNVRYALNLESIESVDLSNRRVYTLGSQDPFHIYDEDSWAKIMQYVNQNLA